MPRASEVKNVCCHNCHRTLILNEGIKCPRCKTVNPLIALFTTELVPDQWITTFLWHPDGRAASSIVITKEIWCNISGRFPNIPSGQMFAVFHLYNYLDPSKAHSKDSGCRINPLDKPFTDIADAMALAEKFEEEALASGKWVRVGEAKTPEPKDPNPAPVWLVDRLVGKRVIISHTGYLRYARFRGVCKAVHVIHPREDNHFDLELENGNRFGFVAEMVTPSTISGPLDTLVGGRREIAVLS